MAKPMKTLELHYPMIPFLIKWDIFAKTHLTFVIQDDNQNFAQEQYIQH